MVKQNKIIIVIVFLLILGLIGFGVYKLLNREKYDDPRDPKGTQNYKYEYPNGLCKNCEVYEKCRKGCYGLTSLCESTCFSECNK